MQFIYIKNRDSANAGAIALPEALVSRAAAAAQAILHECLAVGAFQPLGRRVRVAGRHLLLLAILMRSLGDGLTGHNRERRAHRHQPCRASSYRLLSRTG